jgi:hypothetical protein
MLFIIENFNRVNFVVRILARLTNYGVGALPYFLEDLVLDKAQAPGFVRGKKNIEFTTAFAPNNDTGHRWAASQ